MEGLGVCGIAFCSLPFLTTRPSFPTMPRYDEDDSSSFLDSVEARALLPVMTFADAVIHFLHRGLRYNAEEAGSIYIHYLVARGDLETLMAYLESWPPETRKSLLDTPNYDTYFGNTLHTCAYWNTGLTALTIYRYLVANGATPFCDHYGDYPWAVKGILWPCPVRGYRVSDLHRNDAEFAETHADIERYFGLMTPAGDTAST